MTGNRMRRWYVTAFVVLVCKQNASKLDELGSGKPRVKLVADAADAGFAGELEKIRAKYKLPGIAAAAWRGWRALGDDGRAAATVGVVLADQRPSRQPQRTQSIENCRRVRS